MKKTMTLFGIAFFAIILTTGCGKTKLVCKQKAGQVEVTFNVGFNGNKVVSVDFGYDMDISKYSDSMIKLIEKQNFCSKVKASMSQYKSAFNDCKQSTKNKHIIIKSAFNVKKLTKNQFASVDETKKELEKEGYKCTKK